MTKYRLYTASWCSHCPGAKQAVKDAGLDCEVIDADTSYGRVKSSKDGVKSVPCLIQIVDDKPFEQYTGTQINSELCEKLKGR